VAKEALGEPSLMLTEEICWLVWMGIQSQSRAFPTSSRDCLTLLPFNCHLTIFNFFGSVFPSRCGFLFFFPKKKLKIYY